MWPDAFATAHWPEDLPREETVSNFAKFFDRYGYETCTDILAPGYRHVALFGHAGVVSHVALQDGRQWSSKLGRSNDVAHQLDDLKGELYGDVVAIFRRPDHA